MGVGELRAQMPKRQFLTMAALYYLRVLIGKFISIHVAFEMLDIANILYGFSNPKVQECISCIIAMFFEALDEWFNKRMTTPKPVSL
ncbi:hypothetical protein D8667_24250 [Pseudomonas aeruginosa]|nr:hypothetical protein D8667_24250 [Pseudomonas aeruginosa]